MDGERKGKSHFSRRTQPLILEMIGQNVHYAQSTVVWNVILITL